MLASALPMMAFGLVAANASPAEGGIVDCRVHTAKVALTAGGSKDYTITGELCSTAAERSNGDTVQLLIHGSTYNHTYWDFGTVDGVTYSYARHLATFGFPTFAIDSIGAGQSSQKQPDGTRAPLSAQVTEEVAGYVVHQIVAGLRDGSITGTHFGKVIVVGHSAGSVTVWREAIDYQDVDGLIITGAVHHLSTVGSEDIPNNIYSVANDQKFQNSGFDPGYWTTMPNKRGTLFYNTADNDAYVDDNVILADENNTPFDSATFDNERGKDVFPSAEFAGLELLGTDETLAIKVPVLSVVGSKDDIYCGPDPEGGNLDCSSHTAVARLEASNYSPQAQLRVCVVPNSGHNISLHHDKAHPLLSPPNVLEAAAISWSYGFVGQGGHTAGDGRLPAACG